MRENYTSDIGKLLNDEYKDLKVYDEKQQLRVSLNIYYNHDKIKFLCEKFTFKISLKKTREEEYIRKRLIKKLSCFIRSMHSLVRILPNYYFFLNSKL